MFTEVTVSFYNILIFKFSYNFFFNDWQQKISLDIIFHSPRFQQPTDDSRKCSKCTLGFKRTEMLLTRSSSESTSSSSENSSSGAPRHRRSAGWGRGAASGAGEEETLSWNLMFSSRCRAEVNAGYTCARTAERLVCFIIVFTIRSLKLLFQLF